VAVFFAARCGEKPLPELPRARFAEAEVDAALAALRGRTAEFAPRGDEERLVVDIRAVHEAEAAAARGKESRERGAALYDGFRKAAAAVARADKGRYLLVGERLALELQDAIGPLLDDAREQGTEEVLSGSGAALARAITAGGTFAFKAAERGLIDRRGELRGPRLLPEVLFRKRWCGAVGLTGQEVFSEVERRAELDFAAAFTTDVGQRLDAIEKLAGLDRSYDAVVARALVLHAAERDAEARATIEEAVRRGRDDRPIAMLRDALE
jgi:hypothetical protein